MSNDDNIVPLPLKMPLSLARQVEQLTRPLDAAYAGFPPLEPDHDPAAADWARRKREKIKQASRQQCLDWLTMLGDGLNGVTEEAVRKRALAVWMLCCDLPDLVWSPETLRIMWKRTPFLPTPGECHDVFTAYLAPLLREIEALESIADTPPSVVRTKAPPYVIPPAPEWAGSGLAHRPSRSPLLDGADVAASVGSALKAGPMSALIGPRPPLRTVAEQIAALNAPPVQAG